MNKIIVDTDKLVQEVNDDLYLEVIESKTLSLKIVSNKKIKLLIKVLNSDVKINLELLNNINLAINSLGINSSISYDIKIKDNTNLLVVDSIISNNDSINNINICDDGSNNNIEFYTNGINLKNKKLYFNLNGMVSKNSINTSLSENSKIINVGDGDSKIIPNLIINTKEVIASHSAYIGTFKSEDLYYLASRGISLKYAKKLLIKSILLSKMTIEKEIFTREVSEFIGIGGDTNE
ncbi:MAG: SufD family Fe-S cluster assembly protein [Bacilli bacterium]|nr:SufD family Fe-S cluster assembly protein [Bacilli bacterium]